MATPDSTQGERFAEQPPDAPAIRGFLHRPRAGNGTGLVITHGAGGDCGSSLLVSVAACFAEAGITVLRCDLPFRQEGRQPHPSRAARDREGLRAAVTALRRIVPDRVFLGGQSYGGRQATMLAADDAGAADGLLLLSYPLHPPKQPDKKRTEHLPRLAVPALFFHGTADLFGTREELTAALGLIPAPTKLVFIERAGHSLAPPKSSGMGSNEIAALVLEEFQSFFSL